MHSLTVFLFLFSILPPPQVPSYERSIRVVVVTPDSDRIYITTVTDAIHAVQSGLDWWSNTMPISPTGSILEIDTITSTDDLYRDPLSTTLPWTKPGTITIFAINNIQSHGKLFQTSIFSGTVGFAFNGNVWFLMDYPLPAAAVTHELGHARFDLPDLYYDDPDCAEVDIMCEPQTAYDLHIIGCRSRALLGYPCQKMYLPFVNTYEISSPH